MSAFLVHVTDTHFSDRNPEARIDDYFDALKAKWAQVVSIVKKVNAVAVLHSGDIFHIKAGSRVPHWFTGDVGEMLLSCGCPVIAIAGNHDMKYNSYRLLDEQPFGVLRKHRVVMEAGENGIRLDCGGFPVTVFGVPYMAKFVPMDMESLKLSDVSGCKIVMLHQFVSKARGSMYGIEDVWGVEDIVKGCPLANAFLIGHEHSYVGNTYCGNVLFSQPGAVARIAQSESNERDVCVSLLEVDGSGVKAKCVKLDVKPFAKIFDTVLKEQVKKDRIELEQYVERLNSINWVGGEVTFDDILDVADPDVRSVVECYIANAEREVAA